MRRRRNITRICSGFFGSRRPPLSHSSPSPVVRRRRLSHVAISYKLQASRHQQLMRHRSLSYKRSKSRHSATATTTSATKSTSAFWRAGSGRRIAKWLSDAGHCSRREGERLVEAGRVFVNGEVSLKSQVLQRTLTMPASTPA